MTKILVIDDEQEILSLLNIFLTKKGFEVTTCPSGKQGVEIVKSDDTINLVVLDRRMPDLDGKDAFAEIRKIKSDMPVIMLTGSLEDKTKEIGVNGFLMKPIDLNELLEKINNLIS
jgi:two-component system response regulator ResD